MVIKVNIVISNSSDTPIYLQIVGCIQREIANGALLEGDALPSIRTLARELSVSVITTKKAYEILEGQGYIETRQGRGSFVSQRSGALAREHKISSMEERLFEAVETAKELGIGCEELVKTLEILYESEQEV